jgi:colicin import membrane protein
MARRQTRLHKPKSNAKAWALAIALHVVVITALVIGFRWPSITGQDTDVIQAVTVDSDPQQQAERKKKEEQERKRKAAAERKRKEAEKRRVAEQRKREEEARKRQQAEAARKRQEAEAQRKLVEERKRKEAEEQRKAEAERKRLEQETQRLAQQRQRIEQERQRLEQQRQERERAAEEERKRKEAEKQLAEAMAAEERENQEAKRAARLLTAKEKYLKLIKQKVERNWADPGGSKGLQSTIKVRLALSGDVLTVQTTHSSGNEPFDRSGENAVRKASPLPVPDDPDLFDEFREIEFKFKPES